MSPRNRLFFFVSSVGVEVGCLVMPGCKAEVEEGGGGREVSFYARRISCAGRRRDRLAKQKELTLVILRRRELIKVGMTVGCDEEAVGHQLAKAGHTNITIRIGSTPTILYFDFYLYSA